ncbi:MAG TPA: fused MFS/spermidine synthase [Bacteroidia bacterium]|nr:fused MFS/spermidine synthase [Bacteroidia bacterium]
MFKNALFYISSFIIEREVIRTSSKHNRELKVVLNNGKLVLNSGKANYSFGNLHKVFQKVFSRTQLAKKNIKSALLLGFGTGSVAHILRNELKMNCPITGVELDSEVIKLAHQYFKLASIPDCKIYEQDAQEYIQSTKEKYDLIVVDVFHEIEVPDELLQASFIEHLKNRLTAAGLVYFNFVVDSSNQRNQLTQLKQVFSQQFINNKTYQLLECNYVLVGFKE